MIAAVVETPHGPVTVATTHLSFVPGWNVRQLRTAVRALRTLPAPRILLGDLNLPAGPVRAFTGWRPLARARHLPQPGAPRASSTTCWPTRAASPALGRVVAGPHPAGRHLRPPAAGRAADPPVDAEEHDTPGRPPDPTARRPCGNRTRRSSPANPRCPAGCSPAPRVTAGSSSARAQQRRAGSPWRTRGGGTRGSTEYATSTVPSSSGGPWNPPCPTTTPAPLHRRPGHPVRARRILGDLVAADPPQPLLGEHELGQLDTRETPSRRPGHPSISAVSARGIATQIGSPAPGHDHTARCSAPPLSCAQPHRASAIEGNPHMQVLYTASATATGDGRTATSAPATASST